MNEKILKAINDLKSARDSFGELTKDEQRFVVQSVFGVSAVKETLRIWDVICRNRML